jgi:hypothetical protein
MRRDAGEKSGEGMQEGRRRGRIEVGPSGKKAVEQTETIDKIGASCAVGPSGKKAVEQTETIDKIGASRSVGEKGCRANRDDRQDRCQLRRQRRRGPKTAVEQTEKTGTKNQRRRGPKTAVEQTETIDKIGASCADREDGDQKPKLRATT